MRARGVREGCERGVCERGMKKYSLAPRREIWWCWCVLMLGRVVGSLCGVGVGVGV